MRRDTAPVFTYLRLLVIAAIVCFFNFTLPVQADDDPLRAALLQAHDLLIKAHDESVVDDKISELKQAHEIIHQSSVGPLGRHRQKAAELIDFAIKELSQGDPDNSANRYIEKANRQIGF